MGYRLHLYAVNLEHLYKVLGSKNEKLEAQAFDWLEQTIFSYNAKNEPKFDRKRCREHLHRFIFEGKVGGKKYAYVDDGYYFSSSEKDPTVVMDQFWLNQSILAIFALHPSYKVITDYNRSHYKNVFETFKTSAMPFLEAGKFWTYLLKGRPLKDGIAGGTYYYGYLTTIETALFLEHLNTFYSEMKLKLAEEIGAGGLVALNDNFHFVHDVFVKSVDSGSDLFFCAS